MSVEHVPHRGTPRTWEELRARLEAEASGVHSWSNGPGDRYGEHEHAYRKVLYCVRGSIDFLLSAGPRASGAAAPRGGAEGDRREERSAGSDKVRRISLAAGDRLVIPPGTRHGAVVGPEGCTCIEGQT